MGVYIFIVWHDFKETFLLFWPYIYCNKKARYRLFIAFALLGLDTYCASYWLPQLSRKFIENSQINSSISLIIIALGLMWALEKTFIHLLDLIFFPVINNAIQDISFRTITHLHKIPLLTQQDLAQGEVLSAVKRISDSARSFMKICFIMLVIVLSRIAFTFGVFVQWHWGAAATLLMTTAVYLWILNKNIMSFYMPARKKAWNATDKVNVVLNDSLKNTETVRFFSSTEEVSLKKVLAEEAKLWYGANSRLQLGNIGLNLYLGLTFITMLYWGLYALESGILNSSELILLKTQVISILLPLRSFSVEFRQTWQAVIDIKKVNYILKLALPDTVGHHPKPLKIGLTALVLQGVTFAYPNQAAIFQNLNLKIKSGDKIHLQGKSGSGKSSMLRIMVGLLQPETGLVQLYGQNPQAYQQAELQKNLYYVPQEVNLYNTSLEENLKYGLPAISNHSLEQALEAVGLIHLLRRKHGFKLILGDKAAALSGGEKQRIALARALLIKPRFLILDESTHSLDLAHEKIILERLIPFIETLIFVSHRKTLLKATFNKNMVLHKGRLFESSPNKKINIIDYVLE